MASDVGMDRLVGGFDSDPVADSVIRDSIKNAIRVAQENKFQSIAFPLIGAGSGSFNQDRAKSIMLDELSKIEVPMLVKIVVFKKAKT